MANAYLAEQSGLRIVCDPDAVPGSLGIQWRASISASPFQSLLMSEYPKDIFTEQADIDDDTLAHLGPLTGMAGIWQGTRGLDVKPEADGPAKQAYIERIELQPIDPQSNGPQLFYGLLYHVHITKPDDVETYHSQVGYWLWEPATGMIMHSLTIPRGQTALAIGHAKAKDREFELVAKRGSTENGICSNPFLEHAFRTDEFRIRVRINDNGTWTYEQDTILKIHGQDELFHHKDRNTLSKIGEPTPNPLAREK